MTLQELLLKNKLFRKKLEMAKEEVKPAPVVEETPHVAEIEDEVVEVVLESEKVEEQSEQKPAEAEEEITAEAAPKKKGGKKPANRQYMVVDKIDEVNK